MKTALIFMLIGMFCYDTTANPKECSVRSGSHGIGKRNAIKDKSKLWNDKTIPYKAPGSDFNVTMQEAIKAAIDEFQNKTCLTFVKQTVETDYIYYNLTSSTCAADIGRVGGGQAINLDPSCAMDKASVEHEMMHALGFFHQMCVPDRDKYITINWDNIDPDKKFNFDKCDPKDVDYEDFSFDCCSVMMYNHDAFSNNTKDTIVPAKGNDDTCCNDPVKMGNAEELSVNDIKKIKKLYKCD